MPNGFDGDGPLGPDDGPLQGPKIPDPFVRKYWPFFIGIPLVVLGIVIVDKYYWPFMCFGDDCLTIVANKVTANASNGLTGSFTVEKGSIFNSISSQGVSGACLFVESAALKLPISPPPGGKCTSDDQCGGQLTDPAFKDWEGICHRATKTCWIRPGGGALHSEVCNKGVTLNPGTAPSNSSPFDPSTLKDKLANPANKKIKVRVFACLNGTFPPGPGNAPCGGAPGQKLTDFGDFSEFSTGP